MAADDSVVRFGNAETWTKALALLTGAIRRRWISVTAIVTVFLLVGCAAAAWLPRSYSAEARLLMTKNAVMPALANPRRSVPAGSDVPLESTAEAVLSRHSLEQLARANDMLARWDRERPPLLRLKDRVQMWALGPIAEEDKIEEMVDLLDKRVTVTVATDEVTIKASWTNRQTALDLVQGTLEAFLAARRRADVQIIADTRVMLERRVAAARSQLDQRREALASVTAQPRQVVALSAPSALVVHQAPAAASRPAQDDGLDELRSRLIQIRKSRTEIEKGRQEKLTDLEARLAEHRATQTPRHPDVVALQQALGRLREMPAELVALQDDERRVLADYILRGGDPNRIASSDARLEPGSLPSRSASVQAPEPVLPAPPNVVAPGAQESDSVAYERSLLKSSLDSYQDLVARLSDVQIEFETADAAFAYRYSVIVPARLPKRATTPNVPLVIIGALLAGIFAGVTRAVFRELRVHALLSFAALSQHLSLGRRASTTT